MEQIGESCELLRVSDLERGLEAFAAWYKELVG